MKWLSLFALTLVSSLHGWSRHVVWPAQIEPTLRPKPEIHDFPLNESQEWFVKPSYLIMIPNVDSTDYGYKVDAQSSLDRRFKTERPSFDWGSGVRIGIGRYLPHHDHWDFSLTTSYIYNDSSSHTHVKTSSVPFATIQQNPVIDLGWDTLLNRQALKVETKYLLNYFTWDLQVRRQYILSKNVTFEPFLGLRFPLIYQKYHLRPTGAFYNEITEESFTDKVSFKIRDHFYGGGPRIGYDLSYLFQNQWRFLGQLAASFIYSNQSIHENGSGYVTDRTTNLLTPSQLKYHETTTALRTNLELKLGLGWETWIRQNSVRIAPSFVFEMSEWFDLIHWSQFEEPTSFFRIFDYGFKPEERTGDFGLMGFALNLQIDF